MQGNPASRRGGNRAPRPLPSAASNQNVITLNQLSSNNPHKPQIVGGRGANGDNPAPELALAWERQHGILQESPGQAEDQNRTDTQMLAEADPEGTFAQLQRDQFEDYMNRFFPYQLEAVDIALGNDREQQAMHLAQTSGQFRPSTALQHLHSQPLFLGVNQAMHDVYQQIDEQHWANPVVQEQMRQYGFNQLAEQERNEIADTTSRAFGVGAGIQNRRNQRYGLQTGPSRAQERNRGLSQSLATAGGVNQMRDRREARQAELITGGASAINQQRGALGG